jgi:hypothetical protein
MSRLRLPFVQESEPLEEAMERMRSQDRRAVVVGHRGRDYRLYMNRSVLDARKQRVVESAGLRRFMSAPVAPIASETGHQSTDYGLLSEPAAYDRAVDLMTRTDELAQSILTAVEICECMEGHSYDQPPPRHGSICEHDKTVITCL